MFGMVETFNLVYYFWMFKTCKGSNLTPPSILPLTTSFESVMHIKFREPEKTAFIGYHYHNLKAKSPKIAAKCSGTEFARLHSKIVPQWDLWKRIGAKIFNSSGNRN